MATNNITIFNTINEKILFSYETCVAYFDKNEKMFYQTSRKWSQTTTKHINKFRAHFDIDERNTQFVSQDFLDNKYPFNVERLSMR